MRNQASMFGVLFALSLFPSPMMAAGPDTSIVETAHFDDSMTASSANGNVEVQLRESCIDVSGKDGKREPYRIVVLFEPRSRAFTWDFFRDDKPIADTPRATAWIKRHQAVFLQDSHLLTFEVGGTPGPIEVHNYRVHASSLDDAEQQTLHSVAELNDPPGHFLETKGIHTKYVSIENLGLDFVIAPRHAEMGPPPKVTSVHWDGQHWTLVVQGQWSEAITLDAAFNLISMQKVE